MVERGRKEEGGEVPGRRRGRGRGRRRGRGRGPSSSGSSLTAVEGEQGPGAAEGGGGARGRRPQCRNRWSGGIWRGREGGHSAGIGGVGGGF